MAEHEEMNPFKLAQAQFDHVAEQMGLEQAVREMLRWPLREFRFQLPVRMDDGSIKVFFGFRVQHNDARGRRFDQGLFRLSRATQ